MRSAQLDEANREAEFSEAISRLMRVPSRLKVAVDEDFLLSFQMQVPGKLLPAEMKPLCFQPSGAPRQTYPFADRTFLEPAIHKPDYGRHKLLSFASQLGPQKNKQQEGAGQCSVTDAEACWPSAASLAVPGSHVGLLTEIPVTFPGRKICPFTGQTFDATAEVAGQPRFHSFATCAQQAFVDTIWEEGMSDEPPQVTMERIRQSRLESGLLYPCPSCQAFFGEGRIYSSRNVLRVLHFLGCQLFRLLWGPRRVQISAWRVNLVSDRSLEESGTLEIRAMMEQLSDLSRQLCALEEQSGSWHQKELFLYSMLVSAWLFNTWMWLR